MKRSIALILSVALLFSLSACSLQDIGQSIGEQKNKAVTRGVIDGNVFTSDYADIRFTKPDAWVFANDEEIAEYMNVGKEVLEQNAFEQAAAAMVSVYDMVATDPATGSSVILTYENLKLSGNTSITEEGYFDSFDEQFATQFNFTSSIGERKNVTLGKHSYLRAEYTTELESSGIAMYQYLYARHLGDYMHLVSVTVFNQDDITGFEAMFS